MSERRSDYLSVREQHRLVCGHAECGHAFGDHSEYGCRLCNGRHYFVRSYKPSDRLAQRVGELTDNLSALAAGCHALLNDDQLAQRDTDLIEAVIGNDLETADRLLAAAPSSEPERPSTEGEAGRG